MGNEGGGGAEKNCLLAGSGQNVGDQFGGMEMRKILMVWAAAAMVSAGAFGQGASAFDEKYNAVLSKLQSMGHGYYSDKEWASIDASVKDLVAEASRHYDGNAVVKAAVIEAMVLGDMRRKHA